ncbi:sigma-70 family RNA polymerase sigma factor [Parasphingorhabdus marina]|nr:sigma-70 family RNA polymerase sigma factor [Parasphingorhabdus marina]
MPDKPVVEQGDDALMLRVADKDAEAFRTLVDRHARIPFAIGCRMVKDPAEAEDIAQEAMLRLWNNAEKWTSGGAGVEAWLRRVAVNLCLDRLRKRKRMSDEDVPEQVDDAPTADAVVDNSRQALAVKHCIGKLGDRQRAAVVLTYYEEQSNLDAAGTMDMKLKGFESLLFRARAALKHCLENSPYVLNNQEGDAA